MSKVYVLVDDLHKKTNIIAGVVTNEEVAIRWRVESKYKILRVRDFVALELDDPELLNRIAKEGNKK